MEVALLEGTSFCEGGSRGWRVNLKQTDKWVEVNKDKRYYLFDLSTRYKYYSSLRRVLRRSSFSCWSSSQRRAANDAQRCRQA